MQQRKSKRILIYFVLLFLVSSTHNMHFNKHKFQGIKYIKIVGLDNDDSSILMNDIKSINLDNIFFINEKEINDVINSNNLVEKYQIFKQYPSSLNINIDKTKFLAKINKNGKIFLVGSNGKLSKNNLSHNSVPFIFGNPDIKDFLNFKKIIDRSNLSYNDIKNLYYFSSKRWDLELNNNILIKLSKNYIEDSLKLASKFLQDQNFKDIKIVDARINNQIILND